MSTEVYENAQLNILISNVVATDEELVAFRAGLLKEFSTIQDLKIEVDHMSKQGPHYAVRFNIPGPLYFDDKRLMDVLYAIPLGRWSIDYKAGPKGETAIL
ncbi:hypothetical protein [Duganella vulcania]|uniref:Uncharacterized protein n=1 Tax=Duganella vulcania TaxID=2692166 RepID=A0A845GT40_9BURK|nr:hypothetical protein [Duganella vulcania]MYM96875.1 hypothetical protein [Duganella vulcania]